MTHFDQRGKREGTKPGNRVWKGCNSDCVPTFKPVIGVMLQLPERCQQEKPVSDGVGVPALHLYRPLLSFSFNYSKSDSLPPCHPAWFFYLPLQDFRKTEEFPFALVDDELLGCLLYFYWLCLCVYICMCVLSVDEVMMEEVGQAQLRAGELIIIVVVLVMWAGNLPLQHCSFITAHLSEKHCFWSK